MTMVPRFDVKPEEVLKFVMYRVFKKLEVEKIEYTTLSL